MRRALTSIIAILLALALTIPVVAQDDDTSELLDLRRATQEELADIGRQLDEIQVRKVSEDWVIVRAEDGEYVQVSLERIDELVPWVQMALADQDAAPALLRVIGRRHPDLTKAADQAAAGGWFGLAAAMVASDVLESYTQLKAGDIEGIESKAIRAFIRDFFAGADAQQHRADRYAAFEAQLIEQRETLEILLALFDAELAAREAKSSAAPAECTEADMWCDDADGDEVEYDAMEGLTECEDDDEACDDSGSDPITEASLPPTEEEVTASAPPASDDQHSSADFFLGDWQTDIGVLRIERAGGGLTGTLRSDAGVAQVDVREADDVGLKADFYGPIDAPWVAGLATAEDECPESRRGTTHWGILTMNPWGDDGFRGVWAPCEAEWRREAHLYGEAWTNPIEGTRMVEDAGLASDFAIDDWSGTWSTDFGELELKVFRGVVNGSFDAGASGGFKHAWADLRRQAGDAGSLAGRWLGEYGTHACDERLEGVDYWGDMWLELDGSSGGFTGGFDYCGEGDGNSISGHKTGEIGT